MGVDRGRPVALVTGGGTGLGRAIAGALAEEGYALVLASRSVQHLEHGAAVLRRRGATVLTVPTDVREPARVAELFARVRARFGRLDVLVNNAAGNFLVRSEELTPNGWRAVVGIVLDGTFYCCREAFPLLRRAPSPSIVSIVAAYAWLSGPGTVHSAAAKAGVVALTRTLAVEWAPYGIRVNAVAPGPVRTEGTDRQLWTDRRRIERVRAGIPMGRFGRPREIANAVRFLVGPGAAYITGEVLTVDGGQWLGRGLLDLDAPPGARSARRPTRPARSARGGSGRASPRSAPGR